MHPMRHLITLMEAAVVAPPLPDAFWAWFGQSKVVDAHGKPMIVWHGVKKFDHEIDHANKQLILIPRFEVFNVSKTIEPGAWFSPDPHVAAHYGTPVPFYLKAEKPLREESPIDAVPLDCDSIYRTRSSQETIQDAWEIAVFRPEQIKAVFNRGSFDPHDPRFMF
jgi:hypothetical protein